MRLTLTHNRRAVADVFVRKDDIDNAIRAASGGDLDALATVSTPWGDRPEQGRPITKHRDGSTSLPIHNQHIKIDVTATVVDEDGDEEDEDAALHAELASLIEAVHEYGKATASLEQALDRVLKEMKG